MIGPPSDRQQQFPVSPRVSRQRGFGVVIRFGKWVSSGLCAYGYSPLLTPVDRGGHVGRAPSERTGGCAVRSTYPFVRRLLDYEVSVRPPAVADSIKGLSVGRW